MHLDKEAFFENFLDLEVVEGTIVQEVHTITLSLTRKWDASMPWRRINKFSPPNYWRNEETVRLRSARRRARRPSIRVRRPDKFIEVTKSEIKPLSRTSEIAKYPVRT